MTAVAAVVALALSVINYMQLNHRPTIHLAMPKVIRIAQDAWGVNLHFQPAFTVQEKTEVAAVISSVRIELQGPPGTKKPKFYWWGVADFVQDQNSWDINYKYNSDPTPMVVTQDKPQHANLRFRSIGSTFTVGGWQGSLIAEPQGQSPLVAPFCIDISATDLQTIEQANGTRYFTLRNDQPVDGAQASDSGCYRWAV